MAHYAKVVNGKVTAVIVADQSFIDDYQDPIPELNKYPSSWIKTSYNTKGGVHYQTDSNTPSPTLYYENSGSYFTTEELTSASIAAGTGSLPITASDTSQTLALRGNYAGVGDTYDKTLDVFYSEQPFNSWNLNTGSFLWESPVPYPTGDATGSYTGSYSWYEEELNWVTGSI